MVSIRQQLASRRLFVSFILLGLISICNCTKPDVANRPVVEVNGSVLRAKEFSDLLLDRLKQFDAVGAKDPSVIKRAKEDVIREFVINIIIENWASQAGLFVKAEDLDREIDRIRSGYPDDLSFKQALVEEGIAFQEWRNKISYSILQKMVAEKIKAGAKEPTEQELLSYYKANESEYQRPELLKLSQILVASQSDADIVSEELKKGRPFAELAKKYSIAPEASMGGSLGWIERNSFETFDEAFKIKPGQRTGVLRSPFGYHILLVHEKKGPMTLPFSSAKDRIRRDLLSNREQAVYASWLEERVRMTKVKRDDALVESLKVETRGSE